MHQMVWWSKTKNVHGNKKIKKYLKVTEAANRTLNMTNDRYRMQQSHIYQSGKKVR